MIRIEPLKNGYMIVVEAEGGVQNGLPITKAEFQELHGKLVEMQALEDSVNTGKMVSYRA
jgi:hypothetical protein